MIAAPRKWRPSLVMVTAGMIGVVLAVAVAGFAIVRFNVEATPSVELATAFALALLAAIVVGFVFVRAISRPLSELAERAKQISAGDVSGIGPLSHYGTRELAALSESFMTMAQNLSNRSTYLRTYSRHVSHEFKTPLTAIRGAAELLLDNETMPPEQRRRFLENVLADIERMTALLEKLNQQAQAETAASAGVARVADVASTLRDQFPSLDIVICDVLTHDLAIGVDSLLLVLQHLAANAEQHGARALRVAVSAEGDVARLIVEDDGAGISPGNRERVFDPFFTTRRGEGGTGMGLAIVRSMLEAHRGSIQLSDSQTGAKFELRLPLAGGLLHKIS
jgi:signal transduction histidine kinase